MIPGDRPDAPLPPQAALSDDPYGERGIGTAMLLLEQGSCVARTGWNGKGMFLFRVAGGWICDTRYPALDFLPTDAFVAMRTAQGTIIPWLASQADLLACDWVEVHP